MERNEVEVPPTLEIIMTGRYDKPEVYAAFEAFLHGHGPELEGLMTQAIKLAASAKTKENQW